MNATQFVTALSIRLHLGNGARLPLFEQRRVQAQWEQALSWVRGRRRTLKSLDELLAGRPVRSRHYAGIRPVRIDQIRASGGRTGDFDAAFRPTNTRNRSRWLSVASAHASGTALPPVELLQVGEEYLVRDGHHRISVAKALGAKFIDARVTVWELG